MGKNPFEDDSDVQAMRASMRPAVGPVRWGQVLTGIAIVGCATFAFAYYLPLQRAHTMLNQRFSELQARASAESRALDESRKQAKLLEEKHQALASQFDQAQQNEKARSVASQTIKTALESKLQKALEKNQAAVGVSDARAVASLSLAHLLTPNKLEVGPQGKLSLCGIASASKDRPLRVVAVADKKSVPAPLAAKLKTPLQYSVAVAQLVTETLLDKCSVAPARLSATGVAAEPAALAKLEGKKLSGPRIELWFD
jgi:chemotaxis protein MotB